MLWMARNGVVEMLKQRGRSFPANMADLYLDEEEVERRVRENVPELLDLLVEGEGHETVYVWFAHYVGSRARPVNLPGLREIVADIQKRCPNVGRMILVLREDRTIHGLEEQMRKDAATFRGRVELFSQRDVIMPVATHVFQPKFTILTPTQKEALKRELHIDYNRDLPWMREQDKLARYLGIPKHSVVRVDRPDGSVGYRIVKSTVHVEERAHA